jgi:sugar phosphate permease
MDSEPILSDVGRRTRRRIAWRLLPFLFLLYFIAYLDRVNVSYAGLEMSHDLGLTDRVFGLGAGIFLPVISCSKFRERSSWSAGAPGAGLPAS